MPRGAGNEDPLSYLITLHNSSLCGVRRVRCKGRDDARSPLLAVHGDFRDDLLRDEPTDATGYLLGPDYPGSDLMLIAFGGTGYPRYPVTTTRHAQSWGYPGAEDHRRRHTRGMTRPLESLGKSDLCIWISVTSRHHLRLEASLIAELIQHSGEVGKA
jgi:hypothetical protein